jgi:hypothetical protein
MAILADFHSTSSVFGEKFAVYLRAQFPTHFCIWETGVAPPPYTVSDDTIKLYLIVGGVEPTESAVSEHRKTYLNLITNRRVAAEPTSLKMYGIMRQALSPEGRLAIQSIKEYKTFDLDSDPVGLRNAIFKVHQVSSGAASNCASQIESASFDEYAGCRMKPGQSLLDFKNYFASLVVNLRSNAGYVPYEERQALDFIR